MTQITNFMTAAQADAYGYAASLAAANEPDRAAWTAGVEALRHAEEKAIAEFVGPVRLNRRSQIWGTGTHPSLIALGRYFPLRGVYAPAA